MSTNLCDWNGNNYLVTVDHYSNFIEVDKLPNTLSKTVIKKLRTHMSRYGQCDIFISDNGPQFLSNEFESFAKHWNFIHHTTSPYHPQGNGRAEPAVKIAKSIMSNKPTTGNWLRPERNDAKEKIDRIVKQKRIEKSFNKNAKDLDPLNENDSVRVRPVCIVQSLELNG